MRKHCRPLVDDIPSSCLTSLSHSNILHLKDYKNTTNEHPYSAIFILYYYTRRYESESDSSSNHRSFFSPSLSSTHLSFFSPFPASFPSLFTLLSLFSPSYEYKLLDFLIHKYMYVHAAVFLCMGPEGQQCSYPPSTWRV